MKDYLKSLTAAFANSYSQVFFSDHRLFTVCLLIASFADPVTGLSGAIAALAAIAAAYIIGLSPLMIRNGYYTYNALLTGLAMGSCFCFSAAFVLLLVIAAITALLFTAWMEPAAARYRLPVLSLPFIASIWLILLSAHAFSTPLLHVRSAGSYVMPWTMPETGSQQHLDGSILHLVPLYFRSMSAVFFQNSITAGILITAGLLLYSRISFSLSVIGFSAGLLFFHLFYPGMSELNFSWLSFNFILAALGIGFFLIPSAASYMLVIVAALITGLLISALGILVQPYLLPLYSLPFSICIIMLIAVLSNRYHTRGLHLVQYRFKSPEKNLYAFSAAAERFRKDTYIHIHLPFYGEWQISQGHSGTITHKDAWRHAWDFVVTDESGRSGRAPYARVTDFYCYGLPVTAPADGQVVTIEDGIPDNPVGGMDLKHNWGNTIVIKHAEGLYSKLSHIRESSFKVKPGDHVRRGDLLALCGNSGRSPEPHIHFQLQAVPHVGAETLRYPLSYYVIKENNSYTFRSFDYPAEGDTVIRPTPTALLQQAFHFIPGMKLGFDVNRNGKQYSEQWEVMTDSSNFSYLYCRQSGSVAYFTNNETLFYFTGFTGDTGSLLYYFYLSACKISLSYFPKLKICDVLPLSDRKSIWKPLQDLIAPFYIFMRSSYTAVYEEADNDQLPKKIKIRSEVLTTGIEKKKTEFLLEIENDKIKTITVNEANACITAVNTSF